VDQPDPLPHPCEYWSRVKVNVSEANAGGFVHVGVSVE
jgi:hypothetical protein